MTIVIDCCHHWQQGYLLCWMPGPSKWYKSFILDHFIRSFQPQNTGKGRLEGQESEERKARRGNAKIRSNREVNREQMIKIHPSWVIIPILLYLEALKWGHREHGIFPGCLLALSTLHSPPEEQENVILKKVSHIGRVLLGRKFPMLSIWRFLTSSLWNRIKLGFERIPALVVVKKKSNYMERRTSQHMQISNFKSATKANGN